MLCRSSPNAGDRRTLRSLMNTAERRKTESKALKRDLDGLKLEIYKSEIEGIEKMAAKLKELEFDVTQKKARVEKVQKKIQQKARGEQKARDEIDKLATKMNYDMDHLEWTGPVELVGRLETRLVQVTEEIGPSENGPWTLQSTRIERNGSPRGMLVRMLGLAFP